MNEMIETLLSAPEERLRLARNRDGIWRAAILRRNDSELVRSAVGVTPEDAIRALVKETP